MSSAATFGDRMLSLRDVADALGYSVDAIRGAVKRGELPAVKLLNQYRIAPADLEAWLQANQVAAPTPTRATRPAPSRAASPVRRTSSGERGSFRERARRRDP